MPTTTNKRFYSIRLRIVIVFMLIVCVAFVLVATVLTRMVGEYLFSQKIRDELRVTEDLASSLITPLISRNSQELYSMVCAAANSTGCRVLVLDANGVTQADSLSVSNGQRPALREVETILDGEMISYGYYDLDKSLEHMGYFFYPQKQSGVRTIGIYTASMVLNNSLQGIVLYMSNAESVYENLTQMQNRMLIWLVLFTIAVLILTLMVSRRFTAPIANLSEGIRRMTDGDLSARVNVVGHNEFTQLAEAFNMMCEKLETLDQSRNEFVSNASHELKTPLTSMKILVETLLYGGYTEEAMTKECLTDIDHEIDRLTTIVSDLLTLVHIDSGQMQLKPELLRIDELVCDCVRRLQPIAQSRGIQVTVPVQEKIETTADAKKLDQVFYNLLDNAIKYTPDNGYVRAEITHSGHNVVVRISDSGIGIPKADQLHIFDRFYRVDKARARATGGTGLGLSIVKQIVLLHQGSITVESEENVGSVFTVTLPIITLP